MTLIEAIILSIVQGLTEFIPVSSSGHLEIASKILGLELDGAEKNALFVILHLGTLAALLTYYLRDIQKSLVNFDFKKDKNYLIKLTLAILPILLAGLMFSVLIEDILDENQRFYLASTALIIAGSFFVIATNIYKDKNNLEVKDLNFIQALLIGIFQSIGVIYGVSRSGITISGSRIIGLDNKSSLNFSFIISIPVIFIAGAYEILKNYEFLGNSENIPNLVIGFITSYIVGYLSIKILFKYLRNNNLNVFGYYCIALGILALGINFIS